MKTRHFENFASFLFLAVAVLITAGVFAASTNAEETGLDLKQYRWQNRLLFLFAPEAHHPAFEKLQREIAEKKSGVADRDLVVFEILENGPSRKNSTELDPQTAAALRKRFAAPQNEFTVVLVGKDGGVKMKQQEGVKLADIFGLIDSMPMRREEMRRKGE